MRSLDRADSMESWRGFEPSEVAERVAALLSDRSLQSATLHAQVEDLELRALRNASIAISVASK